MSDLSAFAPRLRPQPVHQRGLYVTVEPYEEGSHGAALWEALGGSAEAVNGLLRFFPQPDFSGPADFYAWLDQQNASGNWVTRVFRTAGDGTVVGMASYMRIDENNGSIEVGAVAHGPAMQRSPIATEVHYLMARHVFDDLGYRRYEWKCHSENAPSRASAERLGFSFEGIFRNHMVAKGKNRDTAWFSMIDCEWPTIRAAFEAWLAPANFDADGRQVRDLRAIRRASGQ
ncbi:GNAT family N-acetyltransferase [Martelella lutilitoris]|uniref:GNAT family N-acetyltransferase n=1 Tax=Martelella lutilitoris TaxID=2583532 RepID=A0A5C4JWU4_9HYPH|nr:GNAT family protein [Martelella lutilitoris]TNB49928.1 GNAT family N-acetyltransferase [Martelella lutilitoris]